MQNRVEYDAEVEWIKKKHGNLEEIRAKLAMSKRQISRLLLVDPSAWSRWVKAGENAPPHVFRMLDWYLRLDEKDPHVTRMEYNLRKYTQEVSQRYIDQQKLSLLEEDESSTHNIEELQREIEILKRQSKTFQKRVGILLIFLLLLIGTKSLFR